jgi:hypothetical protein
MNRSTAIQATSDVTFCVKSLKNSPIGMGLLAEFLCPVLAGFALYLLASGTICESLGRKCGMLVKASV